MAYRGSFSFGFGLTPWVQRLIIVNIGVFLLQSVMPLITPYLQFVPMRILVQPWTMVTYMFAHDGFWHIALNMLVLFFFGPPLEARWGSREFLKYYFICGVGAAAIYSMFAVGGPTVGMIGASGAVYGVMLAFALNWPEAPIYLYGILPVKAKYLVGVMGMMALFLTFRPGGDNVAHAAHLGGIVVGFLYLKLSGPGGPIGNMRRMMNKRKMKVVNVDDSPRASAGPRSVPPAPRSTSRRGPGEEDRLLDELDRVLEKISTQGMSSLTAQERKLLDEVSRRYRTD